MEWYDWVRCATATFSLLAMYFLGLSWVRRSKDYTKRLKDFWWVLNALLFCFVAGSIEQVIRDRGETGVLFISFLASMVALKAAMNKDKSLLKSDDRS